MANGTRKANYTTATIPGRNRFDYSKHEQSVNKFRFALTMTDSALKATDLFVFLQRLYSAAANFEEGYTLGWKLNGYHVYGSHTKEISRFRHFLFDTVRRARAGAVDKEELAELREDILKTSLIFKTFQFDIAPHKGR